jgi:uncharacterized protein (DUF488 family)
MTIFTAGHGSRSFDEFRSLIMEHSITLLVDVRSKPYSRWVPHFNKSHLEEHLPMQYLWMPSLGGLDTSITYERFEEGINSIIRFSKRYKVAVMCSEKDHLKCHRHTKIQPALEERRIKVIHI